MVTVADLKKHEGHYPTPLLYCEHCGCEFSACHGDYFMFSPDHTFTCEDEECVAVGEPMKLVVKRTVYEEVQ